MPSEIWKNIGGILWGQERGEESEEIERLNWMRTHGLSWNAWELVIMMLSLAIVRNAICKFSGDS